MGLLIAGLSYVLSWPVLYDGLQGVDALWHWHITSWVATEFPGLPYWNRWDVSGVPYRNVYPVLPAWVAVAASRLAGVDLFQSLQILQFAITPLLAIGVYAFCDWRLRNPWVGLAATVLFLINPLSWIETVDYFWFANQLGVIFVMPALIALDWFFELWKANDRGRRFRLAAGLFICFAALGGSISPATLTVAPLVLVAYALAAGREKWRQWLFGPVVLLGLAIAGIQLFWMGPLFGFYAITSQRSTPVTFSPELISTVPLQKFLELAPITGVLDTDRYSISPAVWLPALAGVIYAFRDTRARVLTALSALSLVMVTDSSIYYPMSLVPLGGNFVDALYRPAAIDLRFFVPILGGLGLFALPQAIGAWLGPKLRLQVRTIRWTGGVAILAMLGLLYVDVGAFAARVVRPNVLAYGASFEITYQGRGPDIRDMWLRHADVCRDPSPAAPACSSPLLTSTFSVTDLAAGCDSGGGTPRSDVPICLALGPRLAQPTWDRSNDDLIASTVRWCGGRSDPVCSARFDPTWLQFGDPALWRPFAVGCYLSTCRQQASLRADFSRVFPTPPQRLEVQGDLEAFASAGHELTGGATATTIVVSGRRGEPSPDLYGFVENSMLRQRGTGVKQELTAITGIDAVGLGTDQSAQAADYEAMGWVKTSSDPLTYQNPTPAGLATEWEGGNATLVVGAPLNNSAEVYNSVFIRSASTGMIPFASGWLVRGTSPYIDDYSLADLSSYGTIVLSGYRYRSYDAAWSRLASWVQAGGRLFVDSGWQYVDPDWNASSTPPLWPVSSVNWGPLDPTAPVVTGSASTERVDPAFGAFVYHGRGWGASSASQTALRSSAEAVVVVGGRVVVARTTFGRGRVLWSGANLFAHADQSNSASEDALITDQFKWLLPGPVAQQVAVPQNWSGNEAVSIPLVASSGPTLVLFKESLFPGWSAVLVGADGSRHSVQLLDSEYDYMLASLDSVPAGSHLDFAYQPPWTEVAWWISSIVSLIVITAWLGWPRRVMTAVDWAAASARRAARSVWGSLSARWGEEG